MSSKQEILNRLRETPFLSPGQTPPVEHRPVTVVEKRDEAALVDRFILEAKALGIRTYRPADHPAAVQTVLDLIGSEKRVMAWDFSHIALPGLSERLGAEGVEVSRELDASINIGITGADAALAATATLILASGEGKPRSVSLLPQKHVAILPTRQILPNFEAWAQELEIDRLDIFRKTSSITAISGPSRTADIAMEQIIGMHGPGELHIILVQ